MTIRELFREWYDGPESSYRMWLDYAEEHGFTREQANECWCKELE